MCLQCRRHRRPGSARFRKNRFILVSSRTALLFLFCSHFWADFKVDNRKIFFFFFCHFLPGNEISLQFSSVAQSCPTLFDPMNRSMPGLPVHHQLPEFTQTQVHQVSDAIQPSHPLSSPSAPALNPSQHQSLFQ